MHCSQSSGTTSLRRPTSTHVSSKSDSRMSVNVTANLQSNIQSRTSTRVECDGDRRCGRVLAHHWRRDGGVGWRESGRAGHHRAILEEPFRSAGDFSAEPGPRGDLDRRPWVSSTFCMASGLMVSTGACVLRHHCSDSGGGARFRASA